jgi:hypothetical protein
MSAKISKTNAAATAASSISSPMEVEVDMTVPTASIPTASIPTASPVNEEEVELTPELVLDYLPHLDVPQLLEIATAVNTLLKKHWKVTGAKAKAKAEKPKKPASPALLRTQAWTPYVLTYVTENGWEPFLAKDVQRSGSVPNTDNPAFTYKDANTGEIVTPAHIFKDTKKNIIYRDAMSLSSIMKWKTGVKPAEKLKPEEEKEHWSDLYREFMENYQEPELESEEKPKRLTMVEKEEEKERKRQIAEEAKEQKRLAKEEEKEQKRLQKEEEKRRKEEEKEEEKARKMAEKEEEKRRKEEEKEEEKRKKEEAKVKKAPVPVTVIKKVVKVSEKDEKEEAVPKVTKVVKVPETTKTPTKTPTKDAVPKAAKAAPKQLKKITWNIPEDGLVHPWTFEGKNYVVNAEKCVWSITEEGLPGDWVGMVDLEKGIIDTSAEEPVYNDE